MKFLRWLAVLLFLGSAPAWAGYCDGKINGGESMQQQDVVNCVKLPGTFAFATLPNSTSVRIGTTAYTSDQGLVVKTGVGVWSVVSGSSSGISGAMLPGQILVGVAQATFTGTFSGTTLTVSGVTGTIAIGQTVTGTGVATGTIITDGSGTSWTVNNFQSVGPESMSSGSGNTGIGVPPPYPNVVDVTNAPYNADRTGTADSSTIINTAAATQVAGTYPAVHLPSGKFLINNQVNLQAAQCLFGDPKGGTILHRSINFSQSATAAIVLATGNNSITRPCIHDITMVDDQPGDIIQSASASVSSGTTVTVASLTGTTGGTIATGMVIVDNTNTAAIPEMSTGTASVPTTVSSISGSGPYTLTMSAAVIGTIGSSDQLDFALLRSSATALGSCSLTPGSGLCEYPWWIYCNGCQNPDIDGVMISFTWNGVYLHGQTFNVGTLLDGAINVALDVDNCANAPHIGFYEAYPFGLSVTNGQQHAIGQIFYDGTTIAANLGRTDGMLADDIETFTGNINLTANWTFGFITTLGLDNNSANLNNVAGTNGLFLGIGKVYSTKGAYTPGVAINSNPTNASFMLSVDTFPTFTDASNSSSAITIQNGYFATNGGYWWDGLQQTTHPFLVQSGGHVILNGLAMNASASRTDTYISQTGGDITIGSTSRFMTAGGSGAVGVAIGADSALNSVGITAWNSWGETGVTGRSLGYYTQPSGYPFTAFDLEAGSTFTVPLSDNGKTIYYTASGGVTQTLPSASTTAYGQHYTMYKGSTTGNLTTKPAGTDEIEYNGLLYTNSNPLITPLNSSLTLTEQGSGFWYVSNISISQLPASTVANLPACGSVTNGLLWGITDASSPTYNATLTGGSTTPTIGYCNGTNWTAH